jgi:hypothetical protein
MNVERLLRLADFLEELPEGRFDIGQWRNGCGTAGCALGWACSIPEFEDAGLVLEGNIIGDLVPCFNGAGGCSAGASFFGITYQLSCWLFRSQSYSNSYMASVTQVVERIRELCGAPKKTLPALAGDLLTGAGHGVKERERVC